MSYTINKTDGTVIATVADGQIDQNSTDITLIGKNFSGFGEYLNENFVKMLENFSSAGSPPDVPLTGQLWFDTSENRIKVYSGTEWKAVGTSALSSSRPLDISSGDFWFNTTDNQLYFFDGTRDYLLGPDYTASQGLSGVKIESVEDSSRRSRTLISLYIGGSPIGYFSSAEFTPRFPLANFEGTVIRVGFNPIGAEYKFRGTSSNSDQLGGVDSTFYARKNEASTFTEILTVQNNEGIRFGSGPQGQLAVEGFGDIYMRNSSNNKKVSIKAVKNNNSITMIEMSPNATGDDTIDIFPLNTASLTTVGGNLTVKGDLVVEGTAITISSQTVEIQDKLLELGVPSSGSASDTTADGGGILLRGTSDHSIIWDNATDKWDFSENVGIPAGYSYYIGTDAVIEDTGSGIILTSAVTSAPGLTSFGNQIFSVVDNITINNNRIVNNGVTGTYSDGGAANPANIVIEPRGDIIIEGTPNPKIVGISTTNEDSISHAGATPESAAYLATNDPDKLTEVTSKKYVTKFVRTRSIPLTLDITGPYPQTLGAEQPISASDVIAILEEIAPIEEYDVGTIVRIATHRYYVENINEIATTGTHYPNTTGMIETTTLYNVTGDETVSGPTVTTGVIREVTTANIPAQRPPQLYIVRGTWQFHLTAVGLNNVWAELVALTETTPTPYAAVVSTFIRPAY